MQKATIQILFFFIYLPETKTPVMHVQPLLVINTDHLLHVIVLQSGVAEGGQHWASSHWITVLQQLI